jgi:Ca2+-transporting ATPase
VDELVRELDTDRVRGLAPAEAARRLTLFGPNEIGGAHRISPARIFISQFTDFMVLVLIAAAIVSYFLGEAADVVAILAIVVLNAVLGFVQEYRAERAMERLRELAAPTARVVRRGAGTQSWEGAEAGELVIPARELVPGDVVLIEAGDRVAADMRVMEAHSLQTQEAALTGESTPTPKTASVPAESAGLADLAHGLFMGTEVASGRGLGLVVATGATTEFGKIAGLIGRDVRGFTPLQRRMEELGRYLVLACLVVSGLVVWAGILRGEPPLQMLLAGVSLAVAAIPEGLPAVVTILLAMGVQRMIRRRVIVRKLPAVETLGCATVICADKTGTLTQNEMTVRRLWTPAGLYDVTGQGFGLVGAVRPVQGSRGIDPALRLLLVGGVLCANARLARDDAPARVESRRLPPAVRAPDRVIVHGDPTEGALLVAAAKVGLIKSVLDRHFPRLGEIPFSAERRRMTTIHRLGSGGGPGSAVVFCKGAPDTILDLCAHYQGRQGPLALTREGQAKILAVNAGMAASGLRVLAVAYRPLPARTAIDEFTETGLEEGLILAGLVGMSDPPRPEVAQAVKVCHQAGVRVCMITGDHPATALAVAKELHLLDPALPDEKQMLTGRELDRLPDRILARRVEDACVYARVSPGHKLRIVRALRSRGQVVAMTGDGVNDAPAVREADIGVAMGLTGTAVTKEASDMILTDDNFASIVAALEEGRTIYDNIRRSIRYLLSCNTGEILTMLIGALLHLPLPLLPLQILWVNLVTDGLPAMALGLQAPEADVSTRPPRSPRESVFARGLGVKILGRGIIIGLSTIGVYVLALRATGWDLLLARTVAFATLVLSQLVHSFDCRSERRALVEVPLSSNWYLVVGALVSLAMLLGAIYIPELRPFFKTAPLEPREWTWVVLASVWGQIAVGCRRLTYRRHRAGRTAARSRQRRCQEPGPR